MQLSELREKNGFNFLDLVFVNVWVLLPPLSLLLLCTSRGATTSLNWRNAHQAAPILPPPQGLGWEVNDAGALQIRWTEGDLLPQELADTVHSFFLIRIYFIRISRLKFTKV